MQTEILKAIADNPLLYEALHKLLMEQFDTDERTDDAISDVVLGQQYRAKMVAKRVIEQAFKEIRKYRTPEIKKDVRNPAR